jgi:2-hydroxy-3-keto-5-methylthiopentenyl-1-phosphate phosphatase
VAQASYDKNTIAIIYDFDGTLSPQPMQEYTVLPKIGVKPKDFWKEVTKEAREQNADEMLTYMRLLIKYAEKHETHISPEDFEMMGSQIQYYEGVKEWFDLIDGAVKKKTEGRVHVKHYIVSAGMEEILKGIDIKKHFEQIYASSYYFDHHNVACFPNILITGTEKTQYIFRINKGRELIHENVNEYMSEEERPIPFSQMIYLGDGLTDVPSMTVTKNNGGYALAVYRPDSLKELQKCKELLEANRVDFIAPADYREGEDLFCCTQILLNKIISDIEYQCKSVLYEKTRKSRL